jgi:hypothetical protein
VPDQVQGYAGGAGLADLLQLEEARPGHQPPAPDGCQQRDAPFHRLQAGVDAGGDHSGGQVDQVPVLAPRPGGDHDGAAGAQQLSAALQDAGEAVDQSGPGVEGCYMIMIMIIGVAPGTCRRL